MNYSIQSSDKVLGNSDLEHSDLTMGVVHGVFKPEKDYKSVQEIFLLFAKEKYEDYYQKRDSLNLKLFDKSGKCIPTEVIHILDYSPEFDVLSIEIFLKTPSDWSGDAIT